MKQQKFIANFLTITGFVGTLYSCYYFIHRLDNTQLVLFFLATMVASLILFFKGVSLVR